MSELISVYGSPGSGKTSVALKLAMSTYMNTKDSTVIFISSDITVPTIALLFPNYSPDEVCSLSAVLDKTAITVEELLKNTVTVKSMKDFGCLGFKAGETVFSYPTLTENKIDSLFETLKEVSGYIFADCSCMSNDEISLKALKGADKVIRVMTPDLKGMAWLSANRETDRKDKIDLFNVINITDKDLYLPTEEICVKLNSVATVLPYSRAIKQQMLDGRMYEMSHDKTYNKKIDRLRVQVIGGDK